MDSKKGAGPYRPGMHDAGILTLECRDGVEQVLRRVVAEIDGRDLEISAVIDHNGDAADAGLDMPDCKLVVFGHARRRTPLMLAHPTLALDMPLKLLIWRQGDAVFLSFNSTEFLATRHALTDAESDVLRVVAEIAEAAAPA
jgi:uncharacterized protein (DUF302 family)